MQSLARIFHLPLRCLLRVAALVLLQLGIAQALPALAQQPFGTVHQLKGRVTASGVGAIPPRELQAGAKVYVGENLSAGPTGEAVLTTNDAGVIAVRPHTQFVMERFAAQGQRQDGQTLRILSGALRVITGWTGLLRKDSNRIVTPSATVGIRGTDHEPYVIGPQMSVDMDLPEGTYDKVFAGGTLLQSPMGEVAVAPGQVGFAPVVEKLRERALLTVLMPRILDKVPTFYVPGAFDDQLQALAQASMKVAAQSGSIPPASVYAGDEGPAAATAPADAPSGATPPADPETSPGSTAPAAPDSSTCPATALATTWLNTLDKHVLMRSAEGLVAQFAPQARITARIRRTDGGTTQLQFNRDELASSTLQALADLEQFSTRRPVIKARSSNACKTLQVEAVTLESGVRKGSPYRLESVERYQLEWIDGRWLAVRAETEQR